MIAFTPLRTRRLSVQINELSIGDSIYLCKMPAAMNEAGTTETLRRIVAPDLKPRIGQVTDVRMWTVHERAFVISHYLSHTEPTGPDYEIGNSRFSDYFIDSPEVPEAVDIGLIHGEKWKLLPLLGVHAEAIERLIASGRIDGERGGWWIAAMACQLQGEGGSDFAWHEESDAAIDDYIAGMVDYFKAYPQSDGIRLLSSYLEALPQLDHFFRLSFTDEGIVFAQEVAGAAPARFPFDSVIAEFTQKAFGAAI